MKTKTYQGWLGECPYGFLSLADNQTDEYPPSLAENIAEDWKTGEKVSLRYYITDAEVTLEQASEALIVKTFGGEMDVEYVLDAYSEYTIDEWEEGLKIGGHSLVEELVTFAGKYAVIVVEESLLNVSAHTQKESECAAPKTLGTNKMETNDVNKAAPSVDQPRLFRPHWITAPRGYAEPDPPYREELIGWRNKWDCAIDMAARAENALDEMTLRWERTNDALFDERALTDRLAGIIREWRDGYGGQMVDPECGCCDCKWLKPIDEALAARKEARCES